MLPEMWTYETQEGQDDDIVVFWLSFNLYFSVRSPVGPAAAPGNLLDIDPKPTHPEPYGKVRDPAAGSG